jgi:hypothetical protein
MTNSTPHLVNLTRATFASRSISSDWLHLVETDRGLRDLACVETGADIAACTGAVLGAASGAS